MFDSTDGPPRKPVLVQHLAAEPHAGDDAAEGGGVEGLAGHRPRVPQQVQQDDATGGNRQRQRHVEHRHLAGAHTRLGQQVDVVRHRLQAGIGTAALGIRQQQHAGHAGPADVLRQLARFKHSVRQQLRQVGRVGDDAVDDQHQVGGDETEEDRQQDLDRFLQAAQIHHDQQRDEEGFGPKFIRLEAERQEGRQRVDPGGDRDRDGQHVVQHQRRARHQPEVRPDQLGGDAVTAAAGREQLDHLVVGQRDDEDGDRGGGRHVQAEVGMGAQRAEGLLGAVGGRGQPVRTQPDPGQERHQRHRMAGLALHRVEGLAEDDLANLLILHRAHRVAGGCFPG
jgi:hypothetical protein